MSSCSFAALVYPRIYCCAFLEDLGKLQGWPYLMKRFWLINISPNVSRRISTRKLCFDSRRWKSAFLEKRHRISTRENYSTTPAKHSWTQLNIATLGSCAISLPGHSHFLILWGMKLEKLGDLNGMDNVGIPPKIPNFPVGAGPCVPDEVGYQRCPT